MAGDKSVIFGEEYDHRLWFINAEGDEIFKVIRDCINKMGPYIEPELAKYNNDKEKALAAKLLFRGCAELITDRLVALQNRTSNKSESDG